MSNNNNKHDTSSASGCGCDDDDTTENWNDYKFVLSQVQKDGRTICHASEELRNNKVFVLSAIKQYVSKKHGICGWDTDMGEILHYVSLNLRNDPEIISESMKYDGLYERPPLKYASKELQSNKAFVLSAINEYGSRNVHDIGKIMQFVSLELRNDPDIISESIKYTDDDDDDE